MGIEVDEKTNNMLDDILNSFDKQLDKENPFQCIMDITSKITDKYKDKIEQGDINLDGVFSDLQAKLPQMDMLNMFKGVGANATPKEKHIIDENFSTADVELGKVDAAKGPNIAGMLNKFKDIDLGALMNMKIPQNESDAEAMKDNMDNLMKSMNLDMSTIMDKFK